MHYVFQVINGAEILEVLHQLPVIRQFLLSLYECHYAEFFGALGGSTSVSLVQAALSLTLLCTIC